MRKRQRARSEPTGANYFQVDGLWFRLPFPLRIASLLKELDAPAMLRAAKGESADDTMRVWALGGAAIGLCWYSLTEDIEASVTAFDGLHEYGEAVLEELHDAGWTLPQISSAYGAVFARVRESLAALYSAPEVAAREGFTVSPKGART